MGGQKRKKKTSLINEAIFLNLSETQLIKSTLLWNKVYLSVE